MRLHSLIWLIILLKIFFLQFFNFNNCYCFLITMLFFLKNGNRKGDLFLLIINFLKSVKFIWDFLKSVVVFDSNYLTIR